MGSLVLKECQQSGGISLDQCSQAKIALYIAVHDFNYILLIHTRTIQGLFNFDKTANKNPFWNIDIVRLHLSSSIISFDLINQ